MDKSQNPPLVQMDTMSTILTQVSGQTFATVSLDTDALIAACQGAAWKISGWPEKIAIHHAKGCACCHEYINHLLGAQGLRQTNLQHINVKNTVQSAWPAFINNIKIDADQCVQGKLSDLHVQINELKDALRDAKKSYCNAEAVLTKEHSQVKDLEQELKDLKSHLQVEANFSALPLKNVGDSRTKIAGGHTHMVPATTRGRAIMTAPVSARGRALSHTLVSKEMIATSPPKEVNLRSCIAMEVDNEYEWMEEASYKLVDGPLPVSKRQQKKGLGPSVYISAFNSIESLEKNYLAQSPSHLLTDPTLHREREGVLNRIVVDKLAMKNRPLGPTLSVELPPPGETSVGFPWRPVPEHLENLPGIREPLTVGDPPLSQTGQLPRPLG